MTWCIDAVACMRDRIVRGILLACLLGGSAVQAEDYWVLDYQGIEVTAAGSQRDSREWKPARSPAAHRCRPPVATPHKDRSADQLHSAATARTRRRRNVPQRG